MGTAAVAQPLQLSVFVRKDSVFRSESCCASISGFPPIPLSRKINTRYVSSAKGSLSPSGRRNLAPKLDGRRRGWLSRSCFESGVAETAENLADSTASGSQKRPTAPGDEQDTAKDIGKEGDLLELEENELDVFRAAALLDGIEEKLQQLEQQNGKYQGSTHEEEFQEQQQAPASLLGGEGAEPKGLLEQMREIFVFAGPALGIWLSGPLMSIIDTAVIGNSSTLELAALGPGTVFCDQTTYVFMFLSIATSNLIATALAQKDEKEAARHLSRLLFVSLFCGVGMLLLSECFATPLLQGFVGVDNYSLIPAARLYVQIRALAWPVVLMGMVAQSASLGMQDSWAPLKVLAVASFVNLFGDILLCTVLGYGIGGAAWATMASQYVGGFLMLKSLSDKGYNPLAISVPKVAELIYMFNLAGPILLTMLSKVSFYTLITFLATSLGPTTLGAHQVMIGVFSLCTVWGEPLCQTAQSFMPALMYGSSRDLKQARSLLKTLIIIGACLGVTLGCTASLVPWLVPQIFTNDSAIISQMRSVTIPFLLSISLTPATLSCEGTLLAGRDLKFLGFSMALCFCGGTLLLLTLNRLGVGLSGSWWTLVAFQLTRFIQSYSRLVGSESVLADKSSSSGTDAPLQLETVAT